MIVCHCKAATDRDIHCAVECGAKTVAEVGAACGAGTGCGACVEYIGDMLVELAPRPRAKSDAGVDCPGGPLPLTSHAA